MVWLTYNRDVDKNIWRACASHMTSVCICMRILNTSYNFLFYTYVHFKKLT